MKYLIPFLKYLSFASVLFGIKLSIIHFYGNATPYWDQWDHEATYLYKPFLEGSLAISDLVAPLNEHRVLFTRILNLVELKLNGLWNPLLQMTINAALHVGVLCFLVALIIRSIGNKYLNLTLLASLFLFAIPYAWENTLAGIQSMFYFVLFFSTACLWLTTNSKPLSFKWWMGYCCGFFAFFSLASGVFALAASAAIWATIYFFDPKRNRRQLFAIAILGTTFLVGFKLTPVLSYHLPLRASSLSQFFDALKSTLSWPESGGYLASVVRNLPVIFFVYYFIKNPPQARDKKWFLLSLIGWMLVTCIAMAYGRATGSTASRYLDLLAIFILVNLSCVFSLLQEPTLPSKRKPKIWAFVWFFVITTSLVINSSEKLPSQLAEKRDTSRIQELNTRNYLLTNDPQNLFAKPFLHIPYPDPDRLISILSSSTVRSVLPSNLRAPDSTEKGIYDSFINKLLESFKLFIFFGLCLTILIAIYSVLNTKRADK